MPKSSGIRVGRVCDELRVSDKRLKAGLKRAQQHLKAFVVRRSG